MAEIASAFVTIAPSAKGFGSKLNSEIGGDLNSAGKSAGSRFGSAIKVGATAAIGGAVLLGGFLKGAVGEARDAQKVGALTNAVIKSTGGIANVTAEQVDKLATSISLKTGVDDEAIAAGQNMLLTFGNVRNELGKGNDIFNQATVAATDMAAAFGGDAVSNSKMLGKALNDPTKGVSALTRVGVSFTEQQKEQIKTLQESGNVLGAQKIILGELSKQTAGAAESQATAGDKFRTSFGNLQESIGTLLLPALDRALTGLTKFFGFLTNDIGPGIAAINGYIMPLIGTVRDTLQPVLDRMQAWIKQNPAFIKAFAIAMGVLVVAIGAVTLATAAFSLALNSTGIPLIIVGIAALVAGLVLAYQRSDAFRAAVQGVGDIIRDRVVPIIKTFADFLRTSVLPVLTSTAATVGSKLRPILDQLVTTFNAKVLPALTRAVETFRVWQPEIQKAVLAVAKIIGKVVEFGAAVLGKLLPPLIRFVGFVIANVVPAIATGIAMLAKIVNKVIEFGGALVDGVRDAAKFANGVKEKIAEALGFVQGIPGKITAVFAGAGTLLYNAGTQLMSGLASGIRAKINDAVNEVQAGLSRIKGLLPGSPIKWGPLKNWNGGGAGKRLMDLVTLGIEKGSPKTVKAAQEAFGKIGDSLEDQRDKLRSTLDGLKGDFKSLAESVKGAFTGNLFEATTGAGFVENLMGKKADLQHLLRSFTTLKGWGLDPAFLSQLFASGNGSLITELAGMGQSGAVGAAGLFAEVNSLGDQLGQSVAKNDPVSSRIDTTNELLTTVTKQLSFLGSDIGKELNGVAAKAQRDKKGSGKK